MSSITTTPNRRLALNQPHLLPTAHQALESFVKTLETGFNTSSAATYDSTFAADILWGSPFGATVSGFETLNAIHRRFMDDRAGRQKIQSAVGRKSVFEVENVMVPVEGVMVAQIRRRVVEEDGGAESESAGGSGKEQGKAFSEMAMYVLVERDGRWWCAAGQNTIISTPPGVIAAAKGDADNK